MLLLQKKEKEMFAYISQLFQPLHFLVKLLLPEVKCLKCRSYWSVVFKHGILWRLSVTLATDLLDVWKSRMLLKFYLGYDVKRAVLNFFVSPTPFCIICPFLAVIRNLWLRHNLITLFLLNLPICSV